jgi:flagellar secretion chaperone FliS
MSYTNPKSAYLANEQAYIEQRVLDASPVELTCILYEGAIEAIRDAVMFLEQGEVIARGRSISRAQGILMELAQSLSQEADEQLAQRLGLLYEYSVRRLGEAHQSQNANALLEVRGLLENLLEAWRQISPERAQEGAERQELLAVEG